MYKISTRTHGYLDFLTVFIFLVAPSIFDLTSLAATLAYLLAAVHLALTLVTDFPFGIVGIVPFPIHGWVERIVGPLLILVPFFLSGFEQPVARYFYIAIGIVIIAVGFMTDYNAADSDRIKEEKKPLSGQSH